MLEKLDNMMLLALPSDREIVLTRTFDAPRDLVFKAHTDPHLVPLWWGPRTFTTVVDQMDLRSGGVWRFIQQGPNDGEFAFNGVYREIAPPRQIIRTFEFGGMPDHVSLETLTLEEQDGKTSLRTRLVFKTVEDRDSMLHSGMESGAAETYDRLAELLSVLQ